MNIFDSYDKDDFLTSIVGDAVFCKKESEK